MSIREYLQEHEIDAVILDPEGLDKAIIGIGHDGRLVYSYSLLVKAFMDTDGMSEEDAIEWIEYNTIRSIPYMGDTAPIIMYESYELED